MNTTEILTKIKTLLGVETEEVKLAQMKLEDGMTIIESENFAEGDEVVIITEDGKVAVPAGEYTLEDGKIFVVKDEGVIAEVKEKEEEEKEEEPAAEKVEKEEEKEEYSEEAKTPKKIVESVTKESFFSEVETLKSENESLKKELEELKLKATEKIAEEKQEKQEKENEVKEENTTEVELSTKEDPKPIVHNPENKEKVNLGRRISPKKQRTIMDSVFEKIANKK